MTNHAQDQRGGSDRDRLLHVLETAADDPLTIAELRDRGITMPGQAIYELELDGFPIERVHCHGRGRDNRTLRFRLNSQPAGGGRDHPDEGTAS